MSLLRLFSPAVVPPAFAKGRVLPEADASLFSRLVFNWLGPFLSAGFSRPLEKDDLWELPEELWTSSQADNIEVNFYARCAPEDRPASLQSKITAWENLPQTQLEKFLRPSKQDRSLFKALHYTYLELFWTSGLCRLVADTLETTSPLVSKAFLAWLTEAYTWHHLSSDEQASGIMAKPRGIGYGFGIGVALFVMLQVASLFNNHTAYRGMRLGLVARTSIIGAIFRKSLRLSGRARAEHGVGKITTMISADSKHIDSFAEQIHILWVSPIQIIIGIALLIHNMGYSALVAVGVIVFGLPVQMIVVVAMFKLRGSIVKITDKRTRLTTEVLQGIRLIKLYAWETFYSHRVQNLREQEVRVLKLAAMVQALMISVFTFVPILAGVLAFITYSLTGHDLNVSIIFSSLQFLNILRTAVTFLPFALFGLAEALVSVNRITTFLLADELSEPYLVDPQSELALKVDGDFTWETTTSPDKGKAETGDALAAPIPVDAPLPLSELDASGRDKYEKAKHDDPPFVLHKLHLSVQRGAFVAIVGRVGSGKSSILQSLIGEMRRLEGGVIFGGSVAYVPQTPWMRNATLRENIMFGQPYDESKLDNIIRACSLEHDIAMLPNGDMTQIGEKGINLSGGQKARLSLARAAYSPTDIVLLDDPLSAVDAYVGKSILDHCLLSGPLADRTRILVTHALHVLDKTDYIYVVDNGEIKDEGTYSDLMQTSTIFSRLMEEYGSLDTQRQRTLRKDTQKKTGADAEGDEGSLMQYEERVSGAVAWSTYRDFLRFAGGLIWLPIIVALLVLTQVASVGTTLTLGFWTDNTIKGFTQGQYIALYAGFGVAQAVFTWFLSFAFGLAALMAGLTLYRVSVLHVLQSPVSFFDTTPVGRILSRLSKDQDTLDDELSLSLFQFWYTLASVVGIIGLVFYTFPYLGIIFAPMTILYYIIQMYYRRTSIETKRLDSLMRSALYTSYSESLTGLATIRAYREQPRCIQAVEHGLDLENRAKYMTLGIQRWLAVRLELFANVVVLGIVWFAVGFRNTVSPSKIGVVLTYTLSVTGLFSELVNKFAENEQNMNAVERVLVYTELAPEGRPELERPPSTWPAQGGVSFADVEMTYRPGLPLVLKGVSFSINPGEKIGIIGRTGAGKSSLLQALFRIVEIQEGRIKIDGVDIARMSLQTLRSRLAIVPQDSVMFLGTLRDNIDPQHTRTDAELISVLQRTWLLPANSSQDPVADHKFRLDAVVGEEGSNFSAGEKQLLSLARALVKNSRIIILDEATSSVDVETDAKVQRTIQSEFKGSTLLCIAHRLNTIAYYDRILVMDGGCVAEFDTVMNLFDKENSIFRSLCNEANLSKADIRKIRAENLGGDDN